MMHALPADDLTFDGPAAYQIRVRGRIPASWSGRLQGMAITLDAPGAGPSVTSLVGMLPDQASLVGVFDALYELRLPVLSVECLSAQGAANQPSTIPTHSQKE
jgi:hypothetical protein